MVNKYEKKKIYIQALAKAVKECIGDIPPSRYASEYGISTSTMSTLINAKKNFNATTIAEVAEAIGVKTSYIYKLAEENYLPKGFTFIDL